MSPDLVDVRTALIRQWELIAEIVPEIELSRESRCSGWTNREVLAHLYAQPHLVARFLHSESTEGPLLGVAENLAGTKTFTEMIDASARRGASSNQVDLRVPVDDVRSLVLAASLNDTISTLQGRISVSDYLATRCVEAVVHGGDLVPAVEPDPVAQSIASKALLDTLSVSAPDQVPEALMLPVKQWIDLATGRATTTGPLAASLPVMT